MRTQVVDRIKSLALNGVSLSAELPYDESGAAIYIKNPKTLYVDRTQYETVPLIQALNGLNINNTTTSVSVYLAVDAKNPLTQLDSIIQSLRDVTSSIELDGTHTRESTVSTEYENDLLIVNVEYRLTRIN
jgi:biopolymer transport protein ExbD